MRGTPPNGTRMNHASYEPRIHSTVLLDHIICIHTQTLAAGRSVGCQERTINSRTCVDTTATELNTASYEQPRYVSLNHATRLLENETPGKNPLAASSHQERADILRKLLVHTRQQPLVAPTPGGQPPIFFGAASGGCLFVARQFSGDRGNMGSDGPFGDAAFRHSMQYVCV